MFDEVFAVDDRFVDKPLILDPVQEQVKERVVCLSRLEGLIEPALPLAMHLPGVKHGFGTVNGPGLQRALHRGGVSCDLRLVEPRELTVEKRQVCCESARI